MMNSILQRVAGLAVRKYLSLITERVFFFTSVDQKLMLRPQPCQRPLLA
jgi:hypothetical protein